MGGMFGVQKGVIWVCFVKSMYLGYCDGIFLGRMNWCELRSGVGVLLRIFELTLAG